MKHPTVENQHYAMIFVDGFTRKIYIRIFLGKSDTTADWKSFTSEVATHLDLKIKSTFSRLAKRGA